MQILGIGTEIVECPRIGRMIEQHGELFLRRVYTEREIRSCQARRRALEHFAARWAAKEAVLKALGTSWRHGLCWTDLEVRHESDGPPRVLVRGGVRDVVARRGATDILLSLSHCRTYATAYALVVGVLPSAGPPNLEQGDSG
jgi:holo-[acyl-carrier protein] synthase